MTIKHSLLGLLALCCSAPVLAADYPEDPFEFDRRPMADSEIGTAPGQMQFTVLGALVEGDVSDDLYFGGQLGLEYVMHEFYGIRMSGFQDVSESSFSSLDYNVTSIRFGPAMHLQPYRRVDLGSYLEGGMAILDMFGGDQDDTAPEVALGGFITIHLDSFYFVRLELQRSWTTLEIDDVLQSHHRTAAMLGIGAAF
ncbi:hypothetical protein MWU49_00165 [Alcanivorax sp. S6407]|uniref:hypothetical protein n=1 Tax=Alcanivorax sp. S6407 TaxID=2926424 RepID=UPI001FF6CBD0|nr:hypothetical protein [Alcanivorax sp. S6407]MCK0152105.1 hypothetical protein [Alcanivorax sp. S6407]